MSGATQPTHLVIHHSASSRETTLEEIRTWHRAKGWSDIGYHYFIDGDGDLFPGRPFNVIGAHVGGQNTGKIGVCVAGDNTMGDSEWASTQIVTLRIFVQSFLMLFPDAKVVGHGDLPNTNTLCPGVEIAELLGDLLDVPDA